MHLAFVPVWVAALKQEWTLASCLSCKSPIEIHRDRMIRDMAHTALACIAASPGSSDLGGIHVAGTLL
jgi:hypothetical protein